MAERLDSSQQQFCESLSENVRLLAPAGCGKTLSLLFRCKYLSSKTKGQRPKFLVVTFTVAAKQELTSRLNEDQRFAEIRDQIEVTTLNSWGFRRIKSISDSPKLIISKDDYFYTMKNVLQPNWKKYDSIKEAIARKSNTTPRKLMDQIDAFKSLGFDHVRQKNKQQFLERLDELRSQGLEPKIIETLNELSKLGILSSKINQKGEEKIQNSDREVYRNFFRFWVEATQALIERATFTLEDQKYYAYLHEKKKLEERAFLSGAVRYTHILVDEFQDINPLDLALIKAIAERNRASLTIVGDDDQAIFEWRGATPEYILNPSQFLERTFDTYTLKTNYRSPKNIVDMSQKLISNNTRRVDKNVYSNQTSQAKIQVIKVSDLNQAMEMVFSEVGQSIYNGQNPSRVAIIGRKRSQIIPYQIFFASKDIPFCAAEDLQVFMSKAFERLLDLIMIKAQSDTRQMRKQVVDNVIAFCNLVKRYPLSRKDRESLRQYLNQASINTVSSAIEVLKAYKAPLKGKNTDGKTSLAMAEAIQHFLNAKTVSDTLIAMSNNFEGLQTDLGKAEDDVFYIEPPFLYLAEYAVRYKDDYDQFID